MFPPTAAVILLFLVFHQTCESAPLALAGGRRTAAVVELQALGNFIDFL
jgi:hypothetical protein